jgi:Fe-S cluster assembly iron-binding protein IscA
MAQVLSVTPAAVARVRHLVDTVGAGAAGIRIGVRTAGCSGLTYTMDFAREPQGAEARPLTPGVTINGRIAKKGEVDRYRLAVKPGESWMIEM